MAGKAWPAGNGQAPGKGRNTTWRSLRGSLRARLDGRPATLSSLGLATASPALACLADHPVQAR